MSKRKRGFAAFAVLHFIVFAGLCLDRHQKSQRIIGRWQSEDLQNTHTFFADGRVIETRASDGDWLKMEKTYSFVGLNRLRFIYPKLWVDSGVLESPDDAVVTMKANVYEDRIIFYERHGTSNTWLRVKG